MIEVIVSQRRNEAEGICSFELTAADGTALPPHEPGAHIDVHLPNGLIRQYSLCPGSANEGRYLIGVLLEPNSRGGSVAVHALQVGDRLQINVPRNHFPLEAEAQRSILLAGGIGITPLLSMAEQLAARRQDFRLHYGARSASRLAFIDRLNHPTLTGRVSLHVDDGPAEQKLILDQALGPVDRGTHIYVCGPGGFMDWVLGEARRAGWPEEQLHREYFAAPARAQDTQDEAFEIQIGDGGVIYRVPAGSTVIDVLNAYGIEVPVSCEQGVCGTCLTRVLQGQPDHRDSFLTDQERAANNCFTPCCSRSTSALLVLDL